MAIIEHAIHYENLLFGADHTHTSCELMFITKGENEITVKDITYRIGENDLVLIKSRQHHRVRVRPDIEYHRYIVMINPWELKKQLIRPDLFTMLTDISRDGLVILRSVPKLRSTFDRMTDIFNNGGNIYAELSAALEVMSTIYESIRPVRESDRTQSGARLADKVRRYIEENYADNIKVRDMAKENYISEGYLSHAFKAETGMSPREYLSHIRCTRAYELIKHTSMKFTDIADATGFCCANDMSRKIHEYYELSPSQIRAGQQE
ncbi:MAG: helix-turn-helix transcriptional regulator [Oscillospiraceae bacterium]|nr:helix-turn-helix transcriptional regulator [Oscillospiraceae bacterium]